MKNRFFGGWGWWWTIWNAIKQNNNWRTEALCILPLNNCPLWKSCMLNCRCEHLMDVKVTVRWHCHVTLTNTQVCILSKFVSCKLICFLSVCLVGKSCTERTFHQEASWWYCFRETVADAVYVAFWDFCHGSSWGLLSGASWRGEQAAFTACLEMNNFYCIYAHLLCFALELNEHKFKFSQICSFCMILVQNPDMGWFRHVRRGLQTFG